MAKSNKKHFSLRLPLDTAATIETYAQAHRCSKSDALLHYVELGMRADTGEAPATKSDLIALAAKLQEAIAAQPIHVQALPTPDETEKPDPDGWKAKPLLDRLFKR